MLLPESIKVSTREGEVGKYLSFAVALLVVKQLNSELLK